MKRSDRVIAKLENAGGYVTEAIRLLEDVDDFGISNHFASINIALVDARRAMVRIQQGEDPELVRRDLEKNLREAFE